MKVAVGLSGGVDSSVAAALLKDKGYEVTGICMKLWDGAPLNVGRRHACYGPDEVADIEDARRVAEILTIPFHLFDLSQEYKSTILDYFKKEYISGKTPNPCIKCNQRIKFGDLLVKAKGFGIEYDCFATGHYANVEYNEEKRRYLLKKAKDLQKDQSYWLAFLSQKQLSEVIFPLGDYTKGEVRKMAEDFGLNTYDKHDSQDFFSGDHRELLEVAPNPGPIVDRKGNVLGTHKGIWCYTVGQRKGLGIASGTPLYVTAIDEKKNAVVVGSKEELAQEALIASELNYISIDKLVQSMEVKLKVRYSQKEVEGVLSPIEDDKVYVKFKAPQLAITPGQAAVFYDKDIVVGGGIIEKYKDN
ncbi:MAG: tRNA 2-thiouridine(34) synthase MnmA [Thermodesulfobacteriota bacterium]